MPPDITGRNKFAFRDVRDAAELIASGRPPKSLQFNKSNPALKKLSKLGNKIPGSDRLSALASKALPLAAKAALGPVAGAVAAKIAGKFGGALLGKLKGPLSRLGKAATTVTLGVKITEELDPEKIRRPLGASLTQAVSSASASVIGKPLGQTIAKSIATSLLSGAPLASGLPTGARIFKSAAALVHSPRFFNPLQRTFTVDAKDRESALKAVRHVPISTPESRLYPQSGLLEDEIMYRLTLLAENVYAPIRAYAPNVQILEGFRAENSNSSQHERGEAMDITVGSASANFQLAQWIRDNVIYDQLILCHDIVAGSWIHISFTIDARRREVLTKTYNDTFVNGLHVYVPTSGTDTVTQAHITEGDNFTKMLAARQQRLQPVGIDTDLPQQSSDLLGALAGEDEGASDCPGADMQVENILSLAQSVFNSCTHDLTTTQGAGQFVECVVAADTSGVWGLWRKPGGKQYNNHSVELIVYNGTKYNPPRPLYNGKHYQFVDIITKQGSPEAVVSWGPTCPPFDDVDNNWYRVSGCSACAGSSSTTNPNSGNTQGNTPPGGGSTGGSGNPDDGEDGQARLN